MQTPVIDFHTHILPKIDDGSRSTDMSLEMLHRIRAGGTDVIVATPHFYGNREDVSSFLSRRAKSYEELSEQLDGAVPHIILGAEVAFYSGLLSVDYSKLCIAGTNTLLLEMPHSPADFQTLISALLKMRYDAPGVILRHVERVHITTQDDVPWSLDGEFAPSAPEVEIRNLHSAVQLML